MKAPARTERDRLDADAGNRFEPIPDRVVRADRPEPVRPAAHTDSLSDLSAAIRAAQAGDEEAFRVLYRAVQPGLLRYVRGLVGEDAEDVASEAWSQIARDLDSFVGEGNDFRAWTATVARHRALDHLRRQRRRPAATVPVDEIAEPSAPDDTEMSALETVSTRAAIALIATLPREQAEAVLLRVVMGLDAESAGRVLGRRAGTVRTSAHRGLRRLASQLDAAKPATTEVRRGTSRAGSKPAVADG